MQHTRVKNRRYENGEWWYIRPSGKRERIKSHVRKNDKRMFVNGKYISQGHPLWKPGRYKTFEEAAYNSLGKYKETKQGYVYIITNPAWPGWIKIGKAIDATDRLRSYQTYSPFRDYSLEYGCKVEDSLRVETMCKRQLKKTKPEKSEWFKCNPMDAIFIIQELIENDRKNRKE